jgi:Uma2 family endonuclease
MAAVLDPPKLLTTADLLAMPDDGVDRWLIRGQLRENRETDVTRRNRFHSAVMVAIGAALHVWRDRQPKPRGRVLGGEAGCVLTQDPETTVGIDVAYFGPDTVEYQTDVTTMMDGPPVLAVEILSPSEKQEDIDEKIDAYLKAGVKLVWLVNTHLQTITVLRPDAEPQMFNVTQTIDAEPHLPGFSTPVAALFD